MMATAGLRIGLPSAGGALQVALLDALLAESPPYRPLLRCQTGNGILLALEDEGRALAALSGAGSNASLMRITPALDLEPAGDETLIAFLHAHQARVNHIGINLAADTLAQTQWRAFIATAAAALPSYRLEVGSANEVIMVIGDDTVVELVHDHSGAPSSLHVCVEVTASRADVERAFPSPSGGYKPGDEPFFYSVGLPLGAALACYVDFAFADAPAIDWRAIVAAAGQRLG